MSMLQFKHLTQTRSIWKMLGPFATASRHIAIHQVSLLSHAATITCRLRIDVHNDDDNDDNNNAWQRGPLWPHRMGPIINVLHLCQHINKSCKFLQYTSISANADGTRATLPIMLIWPSGSIQIIRRVRWLTAGNHRWLWITHHLGRPSPQGGNANSRPTALAVHRPTVCVPWPNFPSPS